MLTWHFHLVQQQWNPTRDFSVNIFKRRLHVSEVSELFFLSASFFRANSITICQQSRECPGFQCSPREVLGKETQIGLHCRFACLLSAVGVSSSPCLPKLDPAALSQERNLKLLLYTHFQEAEVRPCLSSACCPDLSAISVPKKAIVMRSPRSCTRSHRAVSKTSLYNWCLEERWGGISWAWKLSAAFPMGRWKKRA